jgi:hypothetical protein
LVDSTTIISSLFPDRLEMVLEPIIWWLLVCHKACLVHVLSFLYFFVILDSLYFSFDFRISEICSNWWILPQCF